MVSGVGDVLALIGSRGPYAATASLARLPTCPFPRTCLPSAVKLTQFRLGAHRDSGKIKTKGMVTDVYKIDQYQEALDKMASRGALKIAVKPN